MCVAQKVELNPGKEILLNNVGISYVNASKWFCVWLLSGVPVLSQ